MRYALTLKIGYTYEAPSANARTIVRLLPSDIPGRQVVQRRLLKIDPRPDERRDTLDFFGNAMTVLAFHSQIDGIDLSLEALAERSEPLASLVFFPPSSQTQGRNWGAALLGPSRAASCVGPITSA